MDKLWARKNQLDEPARSQVPQARDFTPKAVSKAVLKETLQHPLTIFPAAATFLGGMYSLLVNFDKASFGFTLGAGFLAVGSWIFNYFIRGETFARRHVASLKEKRVKHWHEEAVDLEAEWKKESFETGAKQASELREAYERLKNYFEKQAADGNDLSSQRFLVLAEDTYREGCRILRKTLALFTAMRQINKDKLLQELSLWEKQLASVNAKGDDSPEVKAKAEALEMRIEGHRKRLNLLKERAGTVYKLLAECETLESALERAYLEATGLSGESATLNSANSASALERAVSAARRAEEKLGAAGLNPESDQIYLDVFQDQKTDPQGDKENG